jgi:hypothetical protein
MLSSAEQAIDHINTAMTNCSMAFTNKSNLGMIFKAITAEWQKVAGLLKTKHMPQDTMT